MRKLLGILGILLFITTSVSAGQKSHKKLAIQLVRIYEKDIDQSYNIPHEVDNIIKQDPSLKPYRKSLIKFMGKYLSKRQLKGYLAQAFMKEFPQDKLSEIVKFLSSPAGKLWIKKSSQFDKTIESIIEKIFSKHEGELIKLINNE